MLKIGLTFDVNREFKKTKIVLKFEDKTLQILRDKLNQFHSLGGFKPFN